MKPAIGASFSEKVPEMPNASPVTLAAESIAQCLLSASEAARRLDPAASQDLRSLLHIAICETERVRKAMRKTAAAAKKPAQTAASKPVKNGRGTMPKAAAQPQSRTATARRSSANGAARAH
jgi:hypothetical protein